MRTLIAAAALTFGALSAHSAVAQQNANTGRICLSSPTGGPLCQFQTMAQCRQAILPTSTQHCFDRSEMESTVGSGGNSPPAPTGGATPPPGDGGQR